MILYLACLLEPLAVAVGVRSGDDQPSTIGQVEGRVEEPEQEEGADRGHSQLGKGGGGRLPAEVNTVAQLT